MILWEEMQNYSAPVSVSRQNDTEDTFGTMLKSFSAPYNGKM